MLLAALLACAPLDPASAQVDGSAAWLYEHAADAEPAQLAEAVTLIADDIGAATMEEPLQTTMTSLSAEAVAAVGRTAVESLPEDEQAAITDADLDAGTYVRLADQQGMMVVTVIPCALDDVEALIASTEQDEIHGGYEAYERRWDGDGEAYFAGEADTLTWTTDYTVEPLPGSVYSATIEGGLRRARSDGGEAFPLGDVVIGRAVLPEPGVFEDGNGYFRQDYQLDALWERAPGETVHLFGVWRDLLVAGFHSSDEGFIGLVSDRSVEADEEIAALCAEEGR